jgi:hypothetical protein
MRIHSSNGLGWGIAVFLPLGLSLFANDKAPSVANIQGKVFMIDTNSSTIMVDTKSGPRRLVVYSPDTKFNNGRGGKGKESSFDQVKEADYISCTGTFDDRARLVAKECLHRESK